MNYFRVQSALIAGIQAIPVQVECAQSRRLPYIQILGGSGSAAAELRERVIAALDSCKLRLPARRLTVQFQPGVRSLPLEQLDLAVAVALLGSSGLIPPGSVENLLVCGRLGLDGSLSSTGNESALRRVLREGEYASALLPWHGSEVLEDHQLKRGGGFRMLAELVDFLRGGISPGRYAFRDPEQEVPPPSQIWNRIPGQEIGKRVIEISAAGAHHVLFSGPAGSRPDLLAHALSALLPPLGQREAEEVRGVYALAGMGHVLPSRPFHVLGSTPGLPSLLRDRRLAGVEEVLLAHHGVLFIDQICEREPGIFPGLLQPMLHGSLLARVQDLRVEIPADAVLVAATPGCSCGGLGDSLLVCTCRPTEARRYQARWRRLHRYPFDLFLSLAPERARGRDSECRWREIASRVEVARERMQKRQGRYNARLSEGDLFEKISWEPKCLRLWEALEGRAPGRRLAYLAVARVAATICDLRAGETVMESDLLEALHYFPGEGARESGRRAPSCSVVSAANSMAMPNVRSP